VRTASDTTLLNYNNWTVRVRRGSQPTPRLLLMLHGWTGDENSMWVFVRNFPEDLWILAPRAPYVAEEGGYSWREPRPGTRGWPTFDDLQPAADAVMQLVDEFSLSNSVTVPSFDVVGFSQGAALTNLLLLHYPQRIHRAGVLAGFMPGGTDQLIQAQPLKGKSVFVAHGTQDQMVSIERAQEEISLLEKAGAQVSFCEAEVAHRVSADCLRALQSFFYAN